MNIFVIQYVNKDIDFKSFVFKYSLEEAIAQAEESCRLWNDETTFQIIEYTPLQK